jgi:hypothetical protein
MPIGVLFAAVLVQLPPSGPLPAEAPEFRAAVAHLEKLLAAAPDKHTVTYEMARTWAAAKQWPETIEWLKKVAAMNAGLDPSRDSIFADLRDTREFEAILASIRLVTPAVSHSQIAFTVAEGDLVPESLAYDPKRQNFYLGSMRKGKVIRCNVAGSCTQFVSGLDTILGLKVHGDHLWLLNNSDRESALIDYDLASARQLHKYAAGPGHNFNDLTIAPTGDIYLSDTRANAVWHLGSELTKLPGNFPFANGIAISPDATLLYVSTFPDGITMLDLRTQTTTPIARPANLCLATIDGLYFHRGALIAIQNAWMQPRIVRLSLTRDHRAITRFEVLERRNPLFEGVTTGVLANNDFFYMANIQDDKKSAFNPITILKLRL